MKRLFTLIAIICCILCLTACGGNGAGGDPAGGNGNGGGNGGPNPLAGKSFSRTDFITQEEITWHFDNAGNARWTGPVSGGQILTYYYHYSVDTVNKLLTLKKLSLGEEMHRTRIMEYDVFGTGLELSDALPSGKTFKQIAEDYWFPVFESDDGQSTEYELSIWHASMDEYEEGEMRFEYRNPKYGDAYYGCSYDITSITETVITGTKCSPQTYAANYEGYPETISISYTATGSGEDMEIRATVTNGSYTDPNTYVLTWESDFNFFTEEQ